MRFLLTLGADVLFKTLTDAFGKLEGRVAYRKAGDLATDRSSGHLLHDLLLKLATEIASFPMNSMVW